MISIKNMTPREFAQFQRKATSKPMSDYALFHQKLKGYDLFLDDMQVCKWSVYANGFTNAAQIISGETKYTCIKRPIIRD